MATSMTGYGRAQRLIDGREITVEIKSINHRYFEFSARTPRGMGYLEEKLKAFVYGRTGRGKVDVNVGIITLEGEPVQVEINWSLAEAYLLALRGLGQTLCLDDDISLSGLSRFGDIYTVRKPEVDESVVWSEVQAVAGEALEKLVVMKEREGERLAGDVSQRIDALEGLVARVEERGPELVEQYRQRLYLKLSELLGDTAVDGQRLLTEAAIFAEKTAVAEETVRLRSHISQARQILSEDGPVGRKLDFLVQEINREANTIGSKVQDVTTAHIVVEMKSEVEKMREQIQNIV